jgi:hypothetical protein
MKHDWEQMPEGIEGIWTHGKRRCKNCRAVQTKHASYEWMRVKSYSWMPRAGRCKPKSELIAELSIDAAPATGF